MKRRDLVLLLGGTLASARALRAQQRAMPVVGYIVSCFAGCGCVPAGTERHWLCRRTKSGNRIPAGRKAITTGCPHWPPHFVDRKVDVIVVGGTPGIAAAKAATSTIPIVFFGGGDLVAAGLITSLARPGGNLTGIGIFGRELNPKRLELLSELIPQAEIIAFLLNPNRSDTELLLRDMQEAARIIDRQLRILKASTDSEIDAAFVTLAQSRTDGLVVAADPFLAPAARSSWHLLHAMPYRPSMSGVNLPRLAASSAMGRAFPAFIVRLGSMSAGFSLVPSLPTCRSSDRRGSSWSSISRLPRRLA